MKFVSFPLCASLLTILNHLQAATINEASTPNAESGSNVEAKTFGFLPSYGSKPWYGNFPWYGTNPGYGTNPEYGTNPGYGGQKDVKKYIGKKLILKGQNSYAYNSILETSLPQPYRIITPDTVGITMDYRPDRLNLKVDSNYIIKGVYYG